jgi:hypothetical protein
MPLPDADKKSPRVYTLSQNTDLENMAFATLQSIGQPINIEEMNEDELRRLVLVNLARLAVKGEWDGLLSAGGGEFNVVLPEDFGDTGYLYDRPIFYPFIAPESGDIGEVGIEFIVASTSSNDIQVGIYSSTATTGAPDTLLGKAVIDSTSTGAVYDTSLTSTVTLVKGTQYWLAVVRSTTQINVTFRAISGSYNPSMFAYNAPNCNGRATCIRLDSSDLTLPSSGITLTNFIPVNLDTPAVSIKIT